MRLSKMISATALIATIALAAPVCAEDAPRQVLFTNVNVFNGIDDGLIENASVLVEGNLIKTVSTDAISAEGAFVVDGEGRTLMPGLIDMHSHLCFRNGMLEFRGDYDQMAAGAYADQSRSYRA